MTAALLGADCPGLRPALKVALGDTVSVGEIVFTDRKNPDIAFAAPLSGRVSSIDYGPRRTLSAFVIEADEDGPNAPIHDPAEAVEMPYGSDEDVRQTLLKRGLWPSFQTRPFGGIPDPDAAPDAIFVNATQASPLAPAPGVVLERQRADFQRGVELLTRLTEGPVYICQAPEDVLYSFSDRVKGAYFSGSLASGLPGTHIHMLHPAHVDRPVWSIGFQDVAAIGHLFNTGQYLADRVISISGPRAAEPRLIRACLGASLRDICQNEIANKNDRRGAILLSGGALYGREAAYMGRYHQQITINNRPFDAGRWQVLSRPSSGQNALIPTAALEQAMAVDVLPVPLMRALSVGDSEAAMRLGCLALVEEDVVALTELCTSGADYGALLRHVLDDLAKDFA